MTEPEADPADEDYGDPFDDPFVDKLLLAIIDAHPEPETSSSTALKRYRQRADRLRVAKDALFGKSGPGRPPNQLEVGRALRWMGQQRVNDLAKRNLAKLPRVVGGAWSTGPTIKLRSNRQLASEAVSYFSLFGSDIADSLRHKFGESESYWIDVARFHDDVPETMEYHELVKISDALRRHGIKLRVSP